MIPFEELDNTASRHTYRTNAEKLIVTGWERRNYPLVPLTPPLPWALASQDQRSWNFHLQSLDLIDGLLRGYSHFAEKRYLAHAFPVALDWIKLHSDRTRTDLSPFAWYDMAVGMGAYRLAYLLDAGRLEGFLENNDDQVIWAALVQHADYLADDSNIAFHNNHGYYQVAGQIAMGRRFAHEAPVMAQAVEQGRERLKRMLDQQFSSDGVHREHSPDYHRMVYDTLKALIDSGLVVDQETITRALRIEEALSWFVFPNQHIVNFGDSDDRSVARQPNDAVKKWNTPEMRFWVSGGRIGKPADDVVRLFPDSGYWVVRKPKLNSESLADYSYLAFNAAFHSRTHKHADDLSFVWFDHSSSILVDAGRYGYIGKAEQGSQLWQDGHWYADPWRVYCESTRAHNAFEIDDLNYLRKGRKPFGSAIQRSVNQDGIYAVEAEVKQFSSIRHVRLLIFKPAHWLLVYDWFKDNYDAPHDVKQWFHLAPHLGLKKNLDDTLVVSGIDSAEPLRITSLLPSLSPEVILAQDGERPQGWWSGKEREIIPAYAFNYRLSGAASGSLASLFSFSPDLKRSDKSIASYSGRSLYFEWTAGGITHSVSIKRESEQPLNIKYKTKKS